MLFNKENNGITEVRYYCPFIYGTLEFSELVNAIILAEEDIIKFVGKDVYKRADKHYHSNNFEFDENIYTSLPDAAISESGSGSASSSASGGLISLNDHLVMRMQAAIAFTAYREFSINNDLSHSTSGRRAAMDREHEQLAWEWMIERDDDGLVRKANKTTDRLIAFLDEYKIPEWINSAIYGETKEVILPDAPSFEKYYPIDTSRSLFIKLLPFIKEMQRRHIKAVTGRYYDNLLGALRGNEVDSDDVVKEMLELARTPLALFTMAVAVKRLSVKLLPDALVQQYKSYITGRNGSFPVKQSEKDGVVDSLMNDAKRELRVLENYVTERVEIDTDSSSGSGEVMNIADRMDSDNKFVRV